jgi:hypothetical protein
LACLRGLGARFVGDTAALNAIENIEQAHISLLTCPDPRYSIAHAYDGGKAGYASNHDDRTSGAANINRRSIWELIGQPLSKVKTPLVQFLLTIHFLHAGKIGLRKRSKWTENDCFNEI